jgi:DNA end-binding protein Ku
MANTRKVALGRFVLRTKQYLATMRAKDGVLVLSTMLYADEVVDMATLDVPTAEDTKPTERELSMAEQLVASLSTEFDPSKYHDTYREQVIELINRKADGEVIAAPAEPAAAAPVVDLMAALEASLAAAKTAGKGNGKEGKDAEDGKKKPARRRASA